MTNIFAFIAEHKKIVFTLVSIITVPLLIYWGCNALFFYNVKLSNYVSTPYTAIKIDGELGMTNKKGWPRMAYSITGLKKRDWFLHSVSQGPIAGYSIQGVLKHKNVKTEPIRDWTVNKILISESYRKDNHDITYIVDKEIEDSETINNLVDIIVNNKNLLQGAERGNKYYGTGWWIVFTFEECSSLVFTCNLYIDKENMEYNYLCSGEKIYAVYGALNEALMGIPKYAEYLEYLNRQRG